MTVVHRFVCEVCGARRELSVGADAPVCVEVSEQMNDFPGGGFVFIRSGVAHGDMRFVGEAEDNPLAALVGQFDAVESDPED